MDGRQAKGIKMELLLTVAIILLGLVVLDILAVAFGADSREWDPNDCSPRPQI